MPSSPRQSFRRAMINVSSRVSSPGGEVDRVSRRAEQSKREDEDDDLRTAICSAAEDVGVFPEDSRIPSVDDDLRDDSNEDTREPGGRDARCD